MLDKLKLEIGISSPLLFNEKWAYRYAQYVDSLPLIQCIFVYVLKCRIEIYGEDYLQKNRLRKLELDHIICDCAQIIIHVKTHA